MKERKKGIKIEIKETNKATRIERKDEEKRDRKKEGYRGDRKNPILTFRNMR